MSDIFHHPGEVSPAASVITIGAFDGVHRGHQHLIGRARESADAHDARVVAITFEPLPVQVFRPEAFPGRILTTQRRRDLLHHFGADVVIELPFDHEMAQETAGEFVDELVTLGPVHALWVGQDFALGHRREGTPERLRELLTPYGAEVHAIDRIDFDGRTVSSSEIRKRIQQGQLREANELMGHRIEVAGEVVKGAQLGRTFGFPTANIAPVPSMVPIKDGIYATFAGVKGERRIPAMTYIGTRPAVNTGQRMIETHLLDFDDDLYGRELVTEFIEHLRPDAGFPSLSELVDQLARDEVRTRSVLADHAPQPF